MRLRNLERTWQIYGRVSEVPAGFSGFSVVPCHDKPAADLTHFPR